MKEQKLLPYQKLNPAITIWLEDEAVALKGMGFTFEKIRDAIPRAARAEIPSRVRLPEVDVPSNLSLTLEEVYEAFKRGIAREPKLTNEEWVALDNRRSEESILSLQIAIRDGDPEAIDVATRVRDHSAKVNGVIVPAALRLRTETALQREEEEESRLYRIDLESCLTISEFQTIALIWARADRRHAAIKGIEPNPKIQEVPITSDPESFSLADDELVAIQLKDMDFKTAWRLVEHFLSRHQGRGYTAEQIAGSLEIETGLVERVLPLSWECKDLGGGQWTWGVIRKILFATDPKD